MRREMLESVVALKRARGRSAHSREVYESLPKDINQRREAISQRCRKECDIVRADARFKAEHMVEGARRLAEEESARAERLVRARLLGSAFALAGEDLGKMAKRDGGAEFADRGLKEFAELGEGGLRDTILARRYAKGLLQVAREKGRVRELMRDMAALGEACAAVPNFVRGLADERVDIERRRDVARSIAKELGLHLAALDALLLIIDKGRVRLIPRVAKYAVDLACRHEGIARATLTVADRSVAQRVKVGVERSLADATLLKVECNVEVDPSLIGGFTVRVDDKRFDASIAGKLARMKEMLYEGAEEF